mmetsp:Transcript_164789/g.528690  ORF Transcript_164789/g.528690 Transcript_164789/m.528690 type:complete len:499 (-) Transcript_164789:73-1569(-)
MSKKRVTSKKNSQHIQGITLLQDRYKISGDKVLGAGGFATVYRGLDTQEIRGVAVKVYHDTTSKAFESFMKSIEVLGKLHKTHKAVRQSQLPGSPSALLSSVFPTPPALLSLMSRGSSGSWDGDCTATSSFKPELLASNVGGLSVLEGGDGGERLPERVLRELSFGDCFVELIAYSKDSFGNPGLDIDAEIYFLVFELGDSSLDEVLQSCNEKGTKFSVDELRSLHWALVSIVCGLHHEGYVHMDIKPVNIVRFSPKPGRNNGGAFLWKLIDLDGAMRTGKEVPLKGIVYTPQYMPPELAKAFCESEGSSRTPGNNPEITLSRLMDIWSVGVCALEAIFLTPVLDIWYSQWRKETGNDIKFMKWLGDYSEDAIISGEMHDALEEINPDLCKFLVGMLCRDPGDRMCITECVNHGWLLPIRQEIHKEIDQFVNLALATQGIAGCRGSIDEEGKQLNGMSSMAVNYTPFSERSMGAEVSSRTAKTNAIKTGISSRTCTTM